jgi:phospholipid/cholesterol/gamma-HCH transport system substrate-binding protein
METNVNQTLVGAFVIILFTMMVLAIIWLSAGFSIEHYSTYEVFMQESVSGLSVDAAVEYNGVSVGTVKSITIDLKNPHLVPILLSIKSNTPITRGTTASLATRGITGIAYIALKDNGLNMTPLTADKKQPYPIIQTAPSLFMRLDIGLNKLINNVTQLSTSIQTILDPENQLAFKETLLNLKQVTNMLAEDNHKLNAIVTNTAQASQQFSPLLRTSQSTMQTLQTQTLPAMNQTLINLNSISQNLLELSTELKQNPSMLIRGKEPQPLGPGEK